MRLLIILCSLLVSFQAFANCRVYIPEKEFNHDGYTVYFDFTEMLGKKNYTEVSDQTEADHILYIEGVEVRGPRFRSAKSVMTIGDLKVEESKLCLTQLCSIRDFAKSFIKSYKKLSKIIPACH